MRIYLLSALLASALFHSQVGINTTDPKTTLEISALDETTHIAGLQAPRITRAQLTAKGNSLYGADQTGAIIFINDISAGDTTGQRANITATGYYYFDGVAWQRMLTQPENIYNTDGTLSGNRTVTQNVNPLTFTSTAVNGFSVDGTTLSVDAANNRIGIGTNTPTHTLDVRGSVKIADGTQGANKVLVSDANGVASWSETPPFISHIGTMSPPGTALDTPANWISDTITLTPGTWIVSAKYTSNNSSSSTFYAWIYIKDRDTGDYIEAVGTVPENTGGRYGTPMVSTLVTVPPGSSRNVAVQGVNSCNCATIAADRGNAYFYAYRLK